MTFPFLEEWRGELEKFELLVDAWEAGDLDATTSIRAVVRKCGSDWLKVPLDQASGDFLLASPLPDGAPENQLSRLQQLSAFLDASSNWR